MHYSTLLTAATLVAATLSSHSVVSAFPHVDTSIPAPGAVGRRNYVEFNSDTLSPLSRHRRSALKDTVQSESATRSRRLKRGKKGRRSCSANSSGSSGSSSSSSSSVGSKLSSSTSSSSTRNATSTGKSSTGSSSGSSSSNSTSTGTTSSGNTAVGLGSDFLNKNGINWGWLPDDGDSGGSKQTMSELNSWLGGNKASFMGYYAQAQSGSTFDGSQLTPVMNDLKSSGAIFVPAVMPTGGWQGLTTSDNSQAVNIAKVMKQFTDEGIEVWLRFAHEVNWYQTDGTYTGTASDFKEAWGVVSDAMDQYAPSVKMFFTPNVAQLSTYQQYYPTSGRVDYIGIDYYPQSTGSFLSTMQPFYDAYCTGKPGAPKFAIGETGLGTAGSIEQRLAWAQEITSAATAKAMPDFVGAMWFSYFKGYDFRLLDGTSGTDGVTQGYFNA